MELHEPRLNLSYGWDLGETEWKTGMDANLVKLGALYGLSVKDRDLSTPPGSPSNGDSYLIKATGTGTWSGHDNEIAVYVASSWKFYAPNQGWACRVEDEDNAIIIYDGTNWVVDSFFVDGGDMSFGTTTGTIIAKTNTQKMGFWGTTPIVQPAHADQAVATPTNTDGTISGLTISAAYSQTEVQALRDACEVVADDMRANNVLLDAIRTALVDAGIIKGSV